MPCLCEGRRGSHCGCPVGGGCLFGCCYFVPVASRVSARHPSYFLSAKPKKVTKKKRATSVPLREPRPGCSFASLTSWGVGLPHSSPLTPHPSLLTPHPSPLTPHPSLLTPHSSFLTPHPSPLTPHSSLLTPHSSFLIPHPSPLTPHPSPLTPHPSPLTPHSSPLTPHPSPLTPHPSPLTKSKAADTPAYNPRLSR